MTAPELARLTLGTACDMYRDGIITETEYLAYRRAWADAGGTQNGYYHAQGWSAPTSSPEVEQLAAEIARNAAQLVRHRR
jgi:hypothetical protein